MTDRGFPTASYQESGRVPDGYEYASEIEYKEALDIATAAAEISVDDVVDFQGGLPTQTVNEVELQTGRNGSTIAGKDDVRTVRIEFEPNTDAPDNPVTGDDVIQLFVDTSEDDEYGNTATVVRNNYHSLHTFTYGDVTAVEPADGDSIADFVVDWQVIPECLNPGYAHPDSRDDISHGEATREKADEEFFHEWTEATDKKALVESTFWVDKELEPLSASSPVMLVPVLYSDGIIQLRDMNSDRPFGYMDVTQAVDKLHDNAVENIDFDLRSELLDDMRYPFGITARNPQHLE